MYWSLRGIEILLIFLIVFFNCFLMIFFLLDFVVIIIVIIEIIIVVILIIIDCYIWFLEDFCNVVWLFVFCVVFGGLGLFIIYFVVWYGSIV